MSDVGSDVGLDDGSDQMTDRIGSLGTLGNIIFNILKPPAVMKYSICWIFLALCHKLYLCICICVFVYLTVGNISFDVLGP